MKRAVICVPNPWDYIPYYEKNYSIMVLNPAATPERNQYLLDNADWSLLVTKDHEQHRPGNDYPDEQVFWYTSGTTGDSKFYGFSSAKLAHVCNQVIKSYGITANDRYVSVMPLWHAHGQLFYWMSRQVGLEMHFLPVSRLQTVHSYDPTFITAIPDILKTLMKQKFGSLRFVRSASSALPEQLYHSMRNQFQVPVIESFGMTETCSHCMTNPLYGEQRVGTVGLPDGIDAKIEDGRLYVRGPAVAHSGWFETGDLAEQDSLGYYRILGRAQDRINVRGYKLDPLSLENHVLNLLPNLKEIAVFGRDTVKCLYVGDYTESQVAEALKSLGQYCRPAYVGQVEVIPKNNSGKVSRSLLNAIY